jgi:hypothetical protein
MGAIFASSLRGYGARQAHGNERGVFCERNGRGTCTLPPTALTFEIRPRWIRGARPVAPVACENGLVGNDGCCGDGVIAVNHVGDCCPVAYIAVPIATLPDFTACCPTGTATVDSLSRCCGPNDILVISSTIANFKYCLPARYHCQFQLLWYHCQRRCAAPPILAAVP